MHTVNFLKNLVEHHHIWAYFFIFIGLVFEGEVILISTGVLAHLGALNFWYALIFVFMGGITKTFAGYYFGLFLKEKYNDSKFLKYIESKVFQIMPRFKQKPFWSIFISKFIMGINYFVVIFSGFQKIDFKKYLKAEISSTLVWAPLLLSIGYFFSYTALHVSREIGRFTLMVLVFTIAFLVFDKLVAMLYELFENLEKNGENK